MPEEPGEGHCGKHRAHPEVSGAPVISSQNREGRDFGEDGGEVTP